MTSKPQKPFSKSNERRAEEILRYRMFRGAGYSDKEIQWAVDVIRQHDPNHPLLRYSERGPIRSDAAE